MPSVTRRALSRLDSTILGVGRLRAGRRLIAQQMTMFHGFYDQWMYHPLVVFDSRGLPAAVLLRPGKAHDCWEAF